MLINHTRALILAAGGMLLLNACGGGRHESTENYALVTSNTKIAYWQEAASGLMDAAKDMGVRADLAGPEAYDTNAEKEAFLGVMARKPAPSGILISAADAELLREPIDSAIAAGIPVITIDSDSPKSKRLTFVGTNNYQAGQIGGELLVKELKGKGDVVVFTIAGPENLNERLEGYKRAIAQSPGIKITQVVDIKGVSSNAFDATEAIVAKGKVPDAFVCLEALSCTEVADVLSRRNVTGKTVIAMDTGKTTLTWIQKGNIRATIAQKPYTMAYFGLRVLDDLHHNPPAHPERTMPKFIDTGTTLVDQSNVASFGN